MRLGRATGRGLVAVDGNALPEQEREQQKQKLQDETTRREHESPDERARRLRDFQKEEERDLRFIREFSQAFDFKLAGIQPIQSHQVYIVRAIPRPGFQASRVGDTAAAKQCQNY